MLRIVHSRRVEELVGRLAEDVRALRRERGALAAVSVVVPSLAVKGYLVRALAEELGVAAGFEWLFLRDLLARAAEVAVPGAELVSVDETEGFLLDLFHDGAFLAPERFAPVRAYLAPEGEGTPAAVVDKRRVALAATLARLFEEYAYTRGDVLEGWARGEGEGEGGGGDATWQRGLWVALFGDGGLARRARSDGRRFVTPVDVLAALVDVLRAGRAAPTVFASPVHVFGVGFVAEGFHRLFEALGAAGSLALYVLEPPGLPASFESLPRFGSLPPASRGSAPKTRQLALGFGAAAPPSHPLLLRWAEPARVNLQALARLAGARVERASPTPVDTDTHLLSRLQAGLPAGAGPVDGTVRVLPCPSQRRQLEIVAAEIWKLAESDPSLRLSEVAVVLPSSDRDEILAQLPTVFRESFDLPCAVEADAGAKAVRLRDAAVRLLRMPLGPIDRLAWGSLLGHPSVAGRFEDVDLARFADLPAALGMRHGADHAAHAGTYIERDVLNFDQGVRRAVLGAAMAGQLAGDESPVRMGEHDYLPFETAGEDQHAALALALLVRSWLGDAAFARTERRTLREWVAFGRGLLASYLVALGSDEEALIDRLGLALDAVASWPLDAKVSYVVASELMTDALAATATRTPLGSEGVAVLGLASARVVPFRHVFVLGLGQGQFPATAGRSTLDLRRDDPRPLDVGPREQDLAMLLDLILGARESLVLTYVARDEISGESLSPSPALIELGEACGLVPEARAPLRRADDQARAPYLPAAARERTAAALGRDLRRHLAERGLFTTPRLDDLSAALPSDAVDEMRAVLGLVASPGVEGGAARPSVSVSMTALRRFLECPLQGSARFRLGLREDEDDDADGGGVEPFASDRLALTMVPREAIEEVLRAGGRARPDELREALARAIERRELRGEGPTGFFAEADRRAFAARLDAWAAQLNAALGDEPARFEAVRVGRGTASGAFARVEPALDVAAGPPRVLIEGGTGLLLRHARAGAGHVVFAASAADQQALWSRFLKAFVDHVVLAAAGVEADVARTAFVFLGAGDEPHAVTARLAPVSSARARAYLADIAADMLDGAASGVRDGVHEYLLPCEAILAEPPADGAAIVQAVQALRDKARNNERGVYACRGPLRDAWRFDPPAPLVAERIVRARFGLWYDTVTMEGA